MMNIESLSGQTLGQYQLRDLLGTGGMGAVYRAYQLTLKREVAIKILPSALAAQPGYMERFNQEAETAAALEHSHIVPIYDYGIQRGTSYIVMRWMTGGTLAQRLALQKNQKQSMPSLGEISDLLDQIASAMDYAHSKGVIHRDIKPANIMFDNQGNAYLADFGIAKLLDTTESHALTETGHTVGTPTYMAPEQWRGEPVVPATDQYALSVMTYMMVTGHLPFEASSAYALMNKHVNDQPTPPSAWRPELPEALGLVLDRGMAKDADDRFPTVTAFAQAFAGAVEGNSGEATNIFKFPMRQRTQIPAKPTTTPALASPIPATKVLSKPVQSRWILPVGVVAVLAVILIVFAVLSRQPQLVTQPTVVLTSIQVANLPTLTADPSASVQPTTQNSGLSAAGSTDQITQSPSATSTIIPTAIPTTVPSEVPATQQILPPTAISTVATAVKTVASSSTQVIITAPQTQTETPSPVPTIPPTTNLTVMAATGLAQASLNQTGTATLWTLTPTNTSTEIPSLTLTLTPTDVPTLIPTHALTATPSLTLTLTSTDTPTVPPTYTLTDTPSLTLTLTQTPTITETPSVTPTLTPVFTSTPAFTLIPSGTAIPTVVANKNWTPQIQSFDGVDMVLVPPGCFLMGSTDAQIKSGAAFSDEAPQTKICFTQPFWIDKTPVWQAQFKQFNGKAATPSKFIGDMQPVEQITWFEANQYCVKNRGTRLPTEAEWEYAARGPDDLVYPWGNSFILSKVVANANARQQTAPVNRTDRIAPSWVGATDMVGNVWEWVNSLYLDYPYSAANNRESQTDTSGNRVLRGGSWYYGPDDGVLRTANRGNNPPSLVYFGAPSDDHNDFGFRCARSF